MAQHVLTLGAPGGDKTLSGTAGKVRRLVLPAGTRRLVVTAEAAFFFEEDTAQALADEADSVPANRHKYAAGTHIIYPAGSGRGGNALRADRFVYLVGTANSQPYWATATAERGAD